MRTCKQMRFGGGSDTRQASKTSCIDERFGAGVVGGGRWTVAAICEVQFWLESGEWSKKASGSWRIGLCQTLWHKLLMSSFYICDLHGHAPHLSHKWNLLERNCIKVASAVVVVAGTCKLFTRPWPTSMTLPTTAPKFWSKQPRPSTPQRPFAGSMMSAKQKLRNKINKYAWAQKLLNWKCALNISALCNSQFAIRSWHFAALPVRHLVRHCTWLTANCTCPHLSQKAKIIWNFN